MKTVVSLDRRTVTNRINRNGNLAVEVALDGDPHAEVILQPGGVIDLGGKINPWPLGDKGWDMPGAPPGFRKFRFEPAESGGETGDT